jgi:polysaccharide export outer membrane protein
MNPRPVGPRRREGGPDTCAPARWRGARAWVACALALLALFALPAATFAQGGADGYRVGPKDLLEIKVYEAPEFSSDLRVSEDGAINLPIHGELVVAGLTDSQVALLVERVIEEHYVQRATVTVQVKEFRFRPISVIGAVAKPGALPYSGRWTLLEVLTAAGGVQSAAPGGVVHVLRRSENGLTDQLTVRLEDLMVKGDPRVNIPIFPADLINVPAATEITVFCLGEVQRPGPVVFKSTERLSLLAAIGRAGGLTDRAAEKMAIKRTGEDGIVREIVVDYDAVLDGKVPDPELRQGDIVVVKESFF